MQKRIISFVITIALLFSILLQIVPVAKATDVVASGTCGEQIQWVLDDLGVLTLTGLGAMSDYGGFTKSWDGSYTYSLLNQPWCKVRKNIRKIVISEGITYIGDTAFSSCENLTSVELPSSLSQIGDAAFQDCNLLEDLVLPSGLTSIGVLAFSYSGLKTIVIPNSLETVEDSAFSYCNSISEVNYSGPQVDFDNIAFGDNNWSLINAKIIYGDEEKADTSVLALGECGEHVSWILTSDGVLTISGSGRMEAWGDYRQVPWYDFAQQIFTVNVKSGVTSIGDLAFAQCHYLTNVTIPDSVTKIYLGGFVGCRRLTEIVIPEGVEEISGNLFADCSALETISIPASIDYISIDAFRNCDNLSDVYYGGSASEWQGITMYSGNTCLTSANIHYNSQSAAPDNSEAPTANSEDGLKRVKQVTVTYSDGDTTETQFIYNEQGLLISTNFVSPYFDEVQVTVYEYDDAKRLTSIQPNSASQPMLWPSVEYIYDSNGFLIESSRAEGGKTTQYYENDSKGRCIRSYSDGDIVTCESKYSYNADGTQKDEIQTQTDLEGNTEKNYISYFYDTSGRITKEVYNGAYYSYTHDYSYQYAPFVAVLEDDIVPYCLYLPDVMGNPTWMIEYIMISSIQTDSDGYLNRIITDTGDIYEFIYEVCEDTKNVPESLPDVNDVATQYARTEWIEQHMEYAASDEYEKEIVGGFIGSLNDLFVEIRDDSAIKAYATLDSANQILSQALSFNIDLSKSQEYELLLAQIFFSYIGEDAIKEIFAENMTAAVIIISEEILKLDIFKQIGDSDQLKGILNALKSAKGIEEMNAACDRFFNFIDSYDNLNIKEHLARNIGKESFNLAWDVAIDSVDLITTTLKELTMYIAVGEAYSQTSDAFGNVLLAMRKNIGIPSDNPLFKPIGTESMVTNEVIWKLIGADNAPQPDPLNTPVVLKDLATAIEDFYTSIDTYKNEDSTYIAQSAITDLRDGAVNDVLINNGANAAVSLLSCLPVVREYKIIKDVLATGQALIDLFTSVEDQEHLGTMLIRLYCVSYLHYLSVDSIAGTPESWNMVSVDLDNYTPGAIFTATDDQDLYESQFSKATRFDEAINVYKSISAVATDYAMEYMNLLLAEATFELLAYNEGGFFDQFLKNRDDLVQAVQQYADFIKSLENQQREIHAIACHNADLQYDPLTDELTYDFKDSRIYVVACPVDVIVTTDTGEQIAYLSGDDNQIASGYEFYFHTIKLKDGSDEYIKVAIVPDEYEIELKGTDDGAMHAFVADFTSGDICEVETYFNIPIEKDSVGYFEISSDNTNEGSLVMDRVTYSNMEQIEDVPTAAKSNGVWIWITGGIIACGIILLVILKKKSRQ